MKRISSQFIRCEASPVGTTSSGRRSAFARRAGRSTLVDVEITELRRLSGQPEFTPAAHDTIIRRPPQSRRLGELLDVTMRLAGVDQNLGAVRPILGRVLARGG